MRKHLFFFLFLCSSLVRAQSVTVPTTLYLADQRMNLSDSGQREIQKRVDELMRFPRYFQAKVDLTDTYFPIIERVFREEGLPDDFKYLVLIESGLVSDAVSTSNAVGFWQFKKETATDYGLTVNSNIDERKHIIESSRSAARYLLKSNNLYYKNWHNTILSYYYGFTGAKSLTKPSDINQKEMEVTDKTDNYILKLLAHKVAYGSAVGRNPKPAVMLQEVPASGKSLSALALEMSVNEGELQRYNKWLAGNYVPNDKTYTVLVPIINPEQQNVILASRPSQGPVASKKETKPLLAGKREYQKRNGLKVIIARAGDTKDQLALQARLSTKRFLSYNDMHSFDPIVAGEAYYLERKNSKADVVYHVVKPGERLQQIAQHYGVRVRSILWNNRMKSDEVLASGRILWMQQRRPSRTPIEFQKKYLEGEPVRKPDNPVVLNPDEVFEEINTARPAAPKLKPARTTPAETPTTEALSSSTETASTTPEAIPASTTVTFTGEQALDEALVHTNEVPAKNEVLLKEEIDQQVEHINQDSPVLYRKPRTGEASTASPKTAAMPAKPAAPIAQKPAVAAKAPVSTPEKNAPTPQAVASPAAPEKALPQEQQPTQEAGFHLVVKGETLYGISRKYNLSVDELKNLNGLDDAPLAIGQRLKVSTPAIPTATASPPPAPGPALASKGEPATHTVSPGESMYQISRRYGVTIKDIMAWNNKNDFNVSPGEKLLIKAVSNSRD